MIVTDSGVPEQWARMLVSRCGDAEVFRMPAGEKNKNLDIFRELLSRMLAFGMHRGDCVAAVGGGVGGQGDRRGQVGQDAEVHDEEMRGQLGHAEILNGRSRDGGEHDVLGRGGQAHAEHD